MPTGFRTKELIEDMQFRRRQILARMTSEDREELILIDAYLRTDGEAKTRLDNEGKPLADGDIVRCPSCTAEVKVHAVQGAFFMEAHIKPAIQGSSLGPQECPSSRQKVEKR